MAENGSLQYLTGGLAGSLMVGDHSAILIVGIEAARPQQAGETGPRYHARPPTIVARLIFAVPVLAGTSASDLRFPRGVNILRMWEFRLG